MRKIILEYNGTQTTEEFEVDNPGLPVFNKFMMDKGFDAIKSFEVFSKGYNIKVDLVNGEILIDNKVIDLDVDDQLKLKLKDGLLRWVNFCRHTVSRRMDGLESRETKYGIGFQANIDGVNVKRYVLVERGNYRLVKE